MGRLCHRAFACFAVGDKVLRESDPDPEIQFRFRDEIDQRPGRFAAARPPRPHQEQSKADIHPCVTGSTLAFLIASSERCYPRDARQLRLLAPQRLREEHRSDPSTPPSLCTSQPRVE